MSPEPMMTPTPAGTVTPLIPAAMKDVRVPVVPMRITPLFGDVPSLDVPRFPMSMLLLPVVILLTALAPTAVLLLPTVLALSGRAAADAERRAGTLRRRCEPSAV